MGTISYRTTMAEIARMQRGDQAEHRITKGVARYASDSGYTVPTALFPRS